MGLNFNFKSTKAQFLSVLCNLAIKKGQFEYQSINKMARGYLSLYWRSKILFEAIYVLGVKEGRPYCKSPPSLLQEFTISFQGGY